MTYDFSRSSEAIPTRDSKAVGDVSVDPDPVAGSASGMPAPAALRQTTPALVQAMRMLSMRRPDREPVQSISLNESMYVGLHHGCQE